MRLLISRAIFSDRFSVQDGLRAIFEKGGIYLFLLILMVIAGVVAPEFYARQNIVNIINMAVPLGIVSIGQTFVILLGGLDISVASIMATSAVVVANMTNGQDHLLVPVGLFCLAFSMAIGLGNGYLVTKRHISPLIATLGMSIVVQGIRFIYTKGAPKGTLPPMLRFLGTGSIGPIPTSVFILAIVFILAALLLYKTPLGRKFYTVGGSPKAASLSGINVDGIIILSFVFSGLLAGLAGLVLAGWIGLVDNWVGKDYELDSIAAVVMGGTSFGGGKGGVGGTLVGVLIMVILFNLVLLLRLPIQTQYIVKGLVIVTAAAFYIKRRMD